MKSFIFLIMLLCFQKVLWAIAAAVSQGQRDSLSDCSEYANDQYVIYSFPYDIHIDPTIQDPSKTTYAKKNDDNIYEMNIVNQECIPPLIYCLQHLEKLVIRNTSFCDSHQRLPAEIERFEFSLIHLGIYDTIMTHLPEQIGKLRRLTFLELSNTGLMFLPNSLVDLSSLTHLYLPKNSLTSLPANMIKLRSLEKITLSNNPHLLCVQVLNGLPSLETLEAKYCSIERLPRNLPNLDVLHMSNNKLKNLAGIHTLGNGTNNTKSFHFDANNITIIRSEIRYVRNLYRLNMNQNRLNNLPPDIFNISTLRYFHIRNNTFRRSDLKEIVKKFKKFNPNLTLTY